VRYHLGKGLVENGDSSYVGGVVDLLKGVKTKDFSLVYHQLSKLLDLHFSSCRGSSLGALKEYYEHVARRRLGEGASKGEVAFSAAELLKRTMAEPDGEGYARELLDALEFLGGPTMYVAIDNIDKALPDEQEQLFKISTRLLKNPAIRLIIPLRKSSVLLGDKFKGLHESPWDEMDLSPLNLKEMLRIRFKYDTAGNSLRGVKYIDPHSQESYSAKELFNLLFGGEKGSPGNLLVDLESPNARSCLRVVKKVIRSDQLKAVRYLSSAEYVVASLMLSDRSEADPYDTHILNLFENLKPGRYGNNLIRYRVLEYFFDQTVASPVDVDLQHHFNWLGLETEEIVDVIALFVGKNLLSSKKWLTPEEIRTLPIEELGPFEITSAGRRYIEFLIPGLQWYWVAAKRSIMLPSHVRSIDQEEGHEFVTHRNLVEYLLNEESKEAEKRRIHVKKLGDRRRNLRSPAAFARDALRRVERDSDDEQ
jgi:hypothetical protein